MNRRGFLGSVLALGAAPAIVRADSLMRIVPRDASFLYKRPAPFEFLPGVVRQVGVLDIARDQLIYRLDVRGANRIGEDVQVFAEFRLPKGAVLDEARKPALAALRDRIQIEGVIPRAGALELPDGLLTASFIE